MSIEAEHVTEASALFFELLRRRMIPNHDRALLPFLEKDEVREALKLMTDEAGVWVVQGPQHVHLVARPEGSVFATSFTHMKRRYPDLETKRYFYLMNVIVLVFLAEVDVEATQRLRWESNGVSYYQLEMQVDSVLKQWGKQQESTAGAFGLSWGLAVEEMIELWDTMAVDDETDRDRLSGNRRTHLGLIHMALRLLKDENLIFIVEDEKRAIPRGELYERLEAVYHHQERFREMKRLVLESAGKQFTGRGEETNAEN
jgi:hypothetical protein